jgi:F0F1-type ATP synthase assembly protein I
VTTGALTASYAGDKMHNREKRQPPRLIRRQDVYRLLGFGWFFGIVLLGGLFGGLAVDNALGTKPLFLLLGMFLGSVVGFFGMFQMLRPYLRRNNNSHQE